MLAVAALLFAGVATPAPRATFDVGITHVAEYGKPHARPLIFVPCLSCGPWIWDRQIAALAPKYDVFTLALPGFDGRPMVRGEDLMRRAVESIHTLITSRRLTNVTVIGHSLGGTITVMFAETYRSDAANIVTVEGGYPEAPTQKQRDAAVARSVAPYEKSSQAQLASALHDNMLQYTITRKADVAAMTALAGRSDPQAIVAWMRAALLLDLTPQLYKIDAPFTAIIPFDPVIDPYGTFKTPAAKLHAYQAWVAHTKRGKVILIQPSRHFVMIDRPREFEAALESAIARVP
ncbi:MAG TPA: alpha/beta fold hydrolase [Candidatus Baltobacteraceae bacterium]|jgi:pimeloyl-ACP methyl ester carboxylesterase